MSRGSIRLRAGFILAGVWLFFSPGLTSCKDRADTSKSSGDSVENSAAGSPSASQPPTARDKTARGPVIDGEHFTIRKIIDTQQGGIPVCIFIAPENWREQSRVTWNYEHNSNPVNVSASVENPTNEEALFCFPAAQCFCLRPQSNFYRPGQNVGGLIHAQPMPPAQALVAVIQQARAGAPKLRILGSKDLPELPAALQLPPSQNQRGVGVKVTYELKGKPVEEEFYGVFYSIDIPYDGPQGRTWQNNWGLNALHSFRAPQGTLERRRPVFAAMAKSFRPNPVWQQRLAAINAYLQEEFNRQLQAGYDQIAAAARLSRQISANNDAMIASIDHQLQTSRSSTSASSGRSSAEKFDDYIRGVETVDDPYYGTSQHSYNQQHHWTDGYGNYRHSNDSTYTPNQTEAGNWQLMEPSH